MELQRPDGGWSQFPGVDSDAYATGQAVYALNVARVPQEDPAYRKDAMIAIGISATPIFIRLTRAQVLHVKVEDYVEAARAVGNSHLRIALRHILPNIVPPLIVQATLAVAAAIIAEAALSFLGLGQQPPAPSWGSMLNTAKNYIDNAPWMAIWPGVSIFLLVLSFNLVGDGLRDALDPRSV